ncbi:MAG: hypothetical protein JJ979_25915, partial [Roseibium sp.]|nr:hypothetical protein [Roseibium sp.]
MNATQVLEALEEIKATSSKTGKEELVKRHLEDPLFKRVVVAAYDPYVTYGLKTKKMTANGVGDLGDTPSKWVILEQLASRTLTGNMARAAYDTLIATSNAPTAEIIWRIVNKDLRAGFTANTVNRVAP